MINILAAKWLQLSTHIAPTAKVWKRLFAQGFRKSGERFSKADVMTGSNSMPGAAITIRERIT